MYILGVMAKYDIEKEDLIVGRKAELQIISKLLKSNESELLAVVGRRRVGKTYLVKHGFGKKLCFHYKGKKDVDRDNQIRTFCTKVSSYSGTKLRTLPDDWDAAFDLLKKLLLKQRRKTKKAIFIDEFPWISITQIWVSVCKDVEGIILLTQMSK